MRNAPDMPDGWTYLDNGFYRIHLALAREIGRGRLPACGHERLVVWQTAVIGGWPVRFPSRVPLSGRLRDSHGWVFNRTGGMVHNAGRAQFHTRYLST